MPLYDYKCPVCSHKREVVLKLSELTSSVYCQRCGNAMNRLVSVPYVRGDYPPYECPVTGKMIEGRRAHEENLKRTGCRILEPGEIADYQRSLRQSEEALEKSLEDTADAIIASWPTEKRDRLAAEMESGITATVERSTPTNV